MKNIYLVKELEIKNRRFKTLNIEAFLTEEAALNYISNELNKYESEIDKYPKMTIDKDNFESAIYNYCGDTTILFDMELMSVVPSTEIPKTIFVYTEVNECSSGEIAAHALGFLTELEAKNEIISEVENRSDEESENYYWISDGDIEDGYIELEDEYGNSFYLECIKIGISRN